MEERVVRMLTIFCFLQLGVLPASLAGRHPFRSLKAPAGTFAQGLLGRNCNSDNSMC